LYGFYSQLTLIPEIDLAVYTSTNGPQSDGYYLCQVLHFIVMDAVLNESTWFTNHTACIFTEPYEHYSMTFPSRHNDSGNGTASDKIHANTNNISDSLSPNALNNYRMYEGMYGHCLFGNITITYDKMAEVLVLKFGLIGIGHLIVNNNDTFYIYLTGAMSLYGRVFELVYKGCLFEFFEVEDYARYESGRYAKIKAIGFEKTAPPVFVRDLEWYAVVCTNKASRDVYGFNSSSGYLLDKSSQFAISLVLGVFYFFICI